MIDASELTHRPDCDPRERTRSSCPCGVLDAYIAEACARLEAMLAARRGDDMAPGGRPMTDRLGR